MDMDKLYDVIKDEAIYTSQYLVNGNADQERKSKPEIPTGSVWTHCNDSSIICWQQ